MTRLHFVKKARKAIRGSGIKKGDSYYWWKFRRGPKLVSKTRPARSRLTRSPFYASMYDLEDRHGALSAEGDDDAEPDNKDDIVDELRGIAEEVRAVGEECQDKHDNMPQGLQEGDTGQLLLERVDQCNEIADSLEAAADEAENAETTVDLQGAVDGVDWSYS